MSKSIFITGSTDGIGLLTAKTLSDQGHNVILHGRSAAKLDAAARDIGGGPSTFQADLSSLTETADLARAVLEKHDHIDVLINNAGVLKAGDPILPNGQDIRFVVNTLAPYVLTQALLPMIHWTTWGPMRKANARSPSGRRNLPKSCRKAQPSFRSIQGRY